MAIPHAAEECSTVVVHVSRGAGMGEWVTCVASFGTLFPSLSYDTVGGRSVWRAPFSASILRKIFSRILVLMAVNWDLGNILPN
jgi:hypothetical protein